MSATTRTRCSSTPSADTFVNPTGSTMRTFPSRGTSPPHRSKRTGVPGRIRTASAERTSTSTSTHPGSPTSSSGVPAATAPSLSCRIASAFPAAGDRTVTFSERGPADAPARVSAAFAPSSSCRATSAASSADPFAALARPASDTTCFSLSLGVSPPSLTRPPPPTPPPPPPPPAPSPRRPHRRLGRQDPPPRGGPGPRVEPLRAHRLDLGDGLPPFHGIPHLESHPPRVSGDGGGDHEPG